METEESARFLFQLDDFEILGEKCILKKAPHPTNIKWENQMPKSRFRIVRKILILCLTVTFITIMTLNLARIDHDFFPRTVNKYDTNLDCDLLYNTYTQIQMENAATNEMNLYL
jgi:hypothetical protein